MICISRNSQARRLRIDRMRYFVGTSGYGIKEWKGKFYPAKLPQKEMLGYYSERFPAVEINSSFRRLPGIDTVESWAHQTPGAFRLVIKAPQRITHIKRLRDVAAEVRELLDTASVLKRRKGPLFFQLPPNFKKDLRRLEGVLKIIGKKSAVTFEFRHASWFDDEVYECLRARSCALCINDDPADSPCTDLVSTANWGYLRLRLERYTDRRLRSWIQKIRSQRWQAAYVFFKHEETGTGPKLAARFSKLLGNC